MKVVLISPYDKPLEIDTANGFTVEMCKPNGKWPTGTYLQRRLEEVRKNPLYQNLYPPTIKEGGK